MDDYNHQNHDEMDYNGSDTTINAEVVAAGTAVVVHNNTSNSNNNNHNNENWIMMADTTSLDGMSQVGSDWLPTNDNIERGGGGGGGRSNNVEEFHNDDNNNDNGEDTTTDSESVDHHYHHHGGHHNDEDGGLADTTTTCHGQDGMDWISRCTWLMTFLIVVGIIGIGLLLWDMSAPNGDSASASAGGGGGDSAFVTTPTTPATPNRPPSSSTPVLLPLTDYYDLLYHHLLHVRQVKGLRDPSTPTYEALEWMAFQDGTVWQFLSSSWNNTIDASLDVPAVEQRFALAAFFFATAGAEFWNSQWISTGIPDCDLDGIACNAQGHVIAIQLSQRSLLGQLPESIVWLTSLEWIELHYNRLLGTLPPSIFTELTHLQYFDVAFNDLTGTLPSDWSALTQLSEFKVPGNSLTGSLPVALPIQSLRILTLAHNLFTGTLPIVEWNAQARLYDTLLTLSSSPSSSSPLSPSNTTTNIMPSDYTNGTIALEWLDVGRTTLTGTLPSIMGKTLQHLLSLSLYQTDIAGMLPTELGQMTVLEELSLGDMNYLTGTFPIDALYQWIQLEWLVLSSTQIHGSFDDIPLVLWSQLSKLQVLNVVNTEWGGTLPTEIGLLTNLEWFQMAHTNVYGTIPSELGQLSKLSTYDYISCHSIMSFLFLLTSFSFPSFFQSFLSIRHNLHQVVFGCMGHPCRGLCQWKYVPCLPSRKICASIAMILSNVPVVTIATN